MSKLARRLTGWTRRDLMQASFSAPHQTDPVIGIMYRPAALLYIAGFFGLMLHFYVGIAGMIGGVIWDEIHWRRK